MSNRFARQWLETLCRIVPQTQSAMLMVIDAGGKTLRPLAKWPENLADAADLAAICKLTLDKNNPTCIAKVLQPDQRDSDFFGMPIVDNSVFLGVIVIKLEHSPADRRQAVFDTLAQSVQWWRKAAGSKATNFMARWWVCLPHVSSKTATARF